MSPQDRQHGREAARRRAARQAAREEQRRKRRRIQVALVASLLVVAVVAGLLSSIGGGDDEVTTDDAFGESDERNDEDTSTTLEPAAFEYGGAECPPEEGGATMPETFAGSPAKCIEDGVDYGAEVVTSEGTFTIDLLEEEAPGTVNNFVFLARWGWYDGVSFHRIVTGFMNQTGDPFGDPPGTGGPGYAFADELWAALPDYTPGAVAMANSGPNTNGSQWFTCVDCSGLPSAAYSLFGRVTEGMDVVEKINTFGSPTGQGTPTKDVTITSVTILEG